MTEVKASPATVQFHGNMRIIDAKPSVVVWLVWMLEGDDIDPRWRRWCSVHASEESARDYAATLQRMDPDATYGIADEYLIGT